MDLYLVEKQIRQHFTDLLPAGSTYGAYADRIGAKPDFYASLDVALARTIMGEDFKRSLTEQQRDEWIHFINAHSHSDGTYDCFGHHSTLHANGMVIGALGSLGGKQLYPVTLYDDFRQVNQVASWLEHIDWCQQWSASHLFWGGMHCFSLSKDCSAEWKATVFHWLDTHCDPQTAWWCRGIKHADRHQGLGGAVHILPIYEHAQRAFPYPQALIDSVLALQLKNHLWLEGVHNGCSYLELDALYVFAYTRTLCPDYKRCEVDHAVNNYADYLETFWTKDGGTFLLHNHPHHILSVVGILGLLQQLLPQRFVHSQPSPQSLRWTDIFSDKRLYQTDAVSVW